MTGVIMYVFAFEFSATILEFILSQEKCHFEEKLRIIEIIYTADLIQLKAGRNIWGPL